MWYLHNHYHKVYLIFWLLTLISSIINANILRNFPPFFFWNFLYFLRFSERKKKGNKIHTECQVAELEWEAANLSGTRRIPMPPHAPFQIFYSFPIKYSFKNRIEGGKNPEISSGLMTTFPSMKYPEKGRVI